MRLHVWWGNAELQGLHIGFFIALAALFVYSFVLNRTTLGYEVRAVGYNPEAARYGGHQCRAQLLPRDGDLGRCSPASAARSTSSAGSTASGRSTSRRRTIGFIGIAVALLGRNTAIGVFFSALLFGALLYGHVDAEPRPEVFPPELAGNLTLMIQALVLLFVGADLLVVYIWNMRRKLRRGAAAVERRRRHDGACRHRAADACSTGCRAAGGRSRGPACSSACSRSSSRCRRSERTRSVWPILLGMLGVAAGIAAVTRGVEPARAGVRSPLSILGIGLGSWRPCSGDAKLDSVFVWSALLAATLRFATPLTSPRSAACSASAPAS